MSGLLTASQLAAMRAPIEEAFTTEATIKRITVGSDVLGDDAVGDPVTIGTVKGWLSSAPTSEPTLDSGSLATVNTFRFDVPVGTDIKPRDQLVIGGNTYVVSDTTADETIPLCLSCSLRLKE
jgi:hypothetical protein